jgi:Na+/melibiose symporter-like transporter
VLNDLIATTWFSYVLILTHQVLGLESWKSALILLGGQLADAIMTPLVGIYSDKAK